MSAHRFTDCWVPIFAAAKRGFSDSAQTYEALVPVLIAMLDSAASRAREQQFTDDQINQAMFAVVAWIDEAALTCDWSGAAQWRSAPLQRHYFSTGRAGVEFFQRLEALPKESNGVREVFGLALLSGFQGKFATRPVVELFQYRRECMKQIMIDNKIAPTDPFNTLFGQPQDALPQRPRLMRRGLPGLAMTLLVGIPLLILCGVYECFDLLLAQQTIPLLEGR